jgi:hypothetical protein
MGVPRKRIKPEQPQLLWDELGRLPIDTEPALTTARGKEVLALGEKHCLTVYDAAYLAARARPPLPIAAGNPRWRFCARQHKQRASRCCKTEGKPIQIHVPSEEPKDGFCRRPRFRPVRQRQVASVASFAKPKKELLHDGPPPLKSGRLRGRQEVHHEILCAVIHEK